MGPVVASTCAARAGKNVLKTPIGRLLKPGGMVRTKGSMQSYHVRRIRSVTETTVSTAAARGSPARPNSAATTGWLVSANALKSSVSIVRWAERRHGLAVVAGGEPGALERRDDATRHRVADLERQVDLAELVEDAHPHAFAQAPGESVVGMHLERGRAVGHVEPAERGGDALVGRRRDQGQRVP